MATENLSLYDIRDVSSDLTRTADRVTFDTMQKGAEAYLSDSKGAAFFNGNFTFRCKLSITSMASGATAFFAGVSNTQDTFQPIQDGSGSEQTPEIFGRGGSNYSIYLIELDSGDFYNAAELTSLQDTGTVYYIEFERDEAVAEFGTIYVTVWTVDYEDTLFGTRSLALHTLKENFQYVSAVQSKQASGSQAMTGYVELLNLDAGAAPGGLSIPVAMHHYTKNIGAY